MTQKNNQDLTEEDSQGAEVTEAQQLFINELEGLDAAADFDPVKAEAEEEARAQGELMDAQTAEMTAVMGLGVIEFSLARLIHKNFKFTPETKAYAIEHLGPVLIKYGALIPDWLMEYEPEINAGKAVIRLASEGIETAGKLKQKEIKAPPESEPKPTSEPTEEEQDFSILEGFESDTTH